MMAAEAGVRECEVGMEGEAASMAVGLEAGPGMEREEASATDPGSPRSLPPTSQQETGAVSSIVCAAPVTSLDIFVTA